MSQQRSNQDALRVLFVLRPDARTRHGGDVLQAANTAAALRLIGVDVAVVETKTPDARGFDIAHVFGMFEPEVCAAQVEACSAAGVPVALSPIWISRREFFARAPVCERTMEKARTADDAARRLTALAKLDTARFMDRRTRVRQDRAEALQREVLRAASVLFPMSALEAREYGLRLHVRNVPFAIVPNAVDHALNQPWAEARTGLLCAGRIESMKNQAITALALRSSPEPLTFVGEAYDPHYLSVVRRFAGPGLTILDKVSPAEVYALFARTKVHVMPSWGEVASIVNLEAAACGMQIVAGDRGSEMEYLGDGAEFADPADPESIAKAVGKSLQRPPRRKGDALDVRVRDLTWRQSAERTLQGYHRALHR
ncbi:MAG TPA: glycosyltransferase family 4 protein [Candidatus Eremiobacteraceae bacterium]